MWLPVSAHPTPERVHQNDQNRHLASLETTMPKVYGELNQIQKNLEAHFRDMQDIEFTIQDGRLWMLQCRIGKRTGLPP